MSVFEPNGALLSIGGAILYTVGGLNPQHLAFSSEARFPAHPIPNGLAYQRTGLGEQSQTVTAKTWPHVMGGLDHYAILLAHHEMQNVVPLIRLKGNYLGVSDGMCVIQSLEKDEEKLHPRDGVGRIVDVTIGLLMMPRSLSGIERGRISGIVGFS